MKIDTTSYGDFGEVVQRLDAIVKQVRGKDTSLEHALDLFDEAIVLGGRAVDLVDKIDFTPEERARLDGEKTSPAPDSAEDAEAAASKHDSAPTSATDNALSQTGGDTEAAQDKAPQTGGDTEAAQDKAPQTGGDTEAAQGKAPQTGGDTEAAQGKAPQTGGDTEAAQDKAPQTDDHA